MQHWAFLIVGKAGFDTPSTGGSTVCEAKPSTPRENEAAKETLPQRRGRALRGLFPKLATWFEDAMDRANRQRIEAYLSQATDLVDLEDRIRRLERRTSY